MGSKALACAAITFAGTHQDTLAGPMGELPATNQRLNGRTATAVQVVDGKIVRQNLYFDQLQVLTDLGLMPAPEIA